MKIFFDGEFTGLDPITNQMLTFCAILTDDNLNIIDEFYGEMKPETINAKTWTIEAQEVHHITKDMAVMFPPAKTTIIRFMKFLKPYLKHGHFDFVCHALPEKFYDPRRKQTSFPHIDFHFLEWSFRKLGFGYSFNKAFRVEQIESTITVRRKATKSHRGHGLGVVCDELGIELDHHNCISDAKACYEIYKHYKGEICLNLESTKKGQLI